MNTLLLASFGQIMNFVWYIVLAILVLLVMITVHELGHYVTGKIFKFKIEEFAIGFGPKIFKKTKKNGEKFSIRALPLGGFCSFHGEDEDNSDPGAFNNKKPWQRIIVLISGALMNYILAVMLVILMFGIYGHTAIYIGHSDGVNEEYTSQYSLHTGDIVIEAEGKNVYLITDLMNAIEDKKKDQIVDMVVIRGEDTLNVQVKLRSDTDFKNVEDLSKLYSALGISDEKEGDTITTYAIYSAGVRFGFFETIGRSFEYSFKIAGTIFRVLGQLITGTLGLGSMGGTVTTISVTANAIKIGGFRNLLNIASFIGVNLAVFNLLPIPALDGSRAVFTTIEWIRGKPINRRVEGIIHTIGFALLLLFAIFIDLQQCF